MNPFTDLLDINDKKSYITLLKQEGLSQSEADHVFETLKLVYQQHQAAFDALYTMRYTNSEPYHIKETAIGPQIHESRVMVYDVLDYQQQGLTRGEIALVLNLKLGQVDVAFAYIDQHRSLLETELLEIKARKAKEEKKYRAIQRTIAQKAQTLPMTREKKALYQLQKTNQTKREQSHADPLK